ncbi:MAG TPA: hypothetical protein VHD35_04695 [Chitinophagaceae bacterium]|jgi:hypothetical protein|nr:hypothetical protein [Chitinophagaceae bacterium]
MAVFSKYFSFYIIGALIIFECKSQKIIPIDTPLQQNSERWIAKLQKQKPHKFYEFGTFNILQAEKTDSFSADNEKGKFFELRPLFGKTEVSKWQKLYNISARYQDDTAQIHLVLSLQTATDIPGFFSRREEETETSIDSLFAEVQLTNNTYRWIIRAGDFHANRQIAGSLSNGREVYSIESINTFAGKENLFGSFPKGIVIKNKNGEELAAQQLHQKKYTWLRKDLSPEEGMLFSICFSTILSCLDKVY